MLSDRRPGPTAIAIAMLTCCMVVIPRHAVACGCCAEAGTWYHESRRLTPEELAEIGRINLGSIAHTVVTPAGLDEIKGITAAAPRYALRHVPPNREWRLEFEGERGSRGTLTFVIPDRGVLYAVDTQDAERDPAGGAVLYKEWRLSGSARGTGAFKGGTFHLVFQGRGNACPDADRFSSWILRIEGPGAAYAVHGILAPATPRPGTVYSGELVAVAVPMTRAEYAAGTAAGVAVTPQQHAVAAAAVVLRRGDQFFTSPEEAVRTLTALLRKEDWATIARYYDLTFSAIEVRELRSGRFFLHDRRPDGAHPALPWKYKHPFTPGFVYQGVEATADPTIVRVLLAVEIDQGGGMIQRVRSEFQMRRHANGYQVLPPL